MPWELQAREDYERSCEACEQTLALPRARTSALRAEPAFGAEARALREALEQGGG